jgi:hypothetical protein
MTHDAASEVQLGFPSYDRWMSLGALIAGLSGSAAFGWYVYALQSNGKSDFWSPPGITLVAVTGVGLAVFLIGFFKREDEEKASTPRPDIPEEHLTRIAYDIGDEGTVRSRNARIRNHGTAFKVRGKGRLDEKGSDIA